MRSMAKSIINNRYFDIAIRFLIIISIITFSIDTVEGLNSITKETLAKIEISIVVIFTLEYIIRLIASKKASHYIFSFYGIIDLIAILPFYITTGFDGRSIRILRLLRLLKLIKYNKTIEYLHKAFSKIRDELILFLIITSITVYLSGVGIYYFERFAQPEQFGSVFHSLWRAIVTLTTVGYGDVYPITLGGKIFTFIILLIGVGIIAIPSGLVASALTETKREK